MRRIFKVFSLLLALIMACNVFPVFAADEDATIERIGDFTVALAVGESAQLEVKVESSDPDEKVTWVCDSLEYGYFTLSDDGYVTALKPGGGEVRAMLENGEETWFYVSVYSDPNRITFDKDYYVVILGSESSTYVNTYVYPQEAFDCPVVLSIEDTSIADIDEDGEIIPYAEGTTSIIATAKTGLTASVQLDVISGDYADDVTIVADSYPVYLKEGETVQLSYELSCEADESKTEFEDEKVIWKVAPQMYDWGTEGITVNQSGEVTAVANGSYTVSAEITNGRCDYISVVVAPEITKLAFDSSMPSKLSLDSYWYFQDYLKASPEDAQNRIDGDNIVWTSSNTSVIEFEEWGGCNIVGTGTTKITAALKDNPSVFATKTVEVYEATAPTAIRRVTDENVELHMGYYYTSDPLFKIAYDPDTANTSTSWESEDTDILVAYGNGTVANFWFQKAGGPVKVTATSEENPALSTSFNVMMYEEPYENETYTTNVLFGKANNNTFYDLVYNPAVYTMTLGEEYLIQFEDDGELYIPSPDVRLAMFDDSEIFVRDSYFNLFASVDEDGVHGNPAVIVYANAVGEETYSAGPFEFTIRVIDPDHEHEYELAGWTWADDYSSAYATFVCTCGETTDVDAVITKDGDIYTASVEFNGKTYTDTREEGIVLIDEAFMTSEMFEEPEVGVELIWPEDMEVPEGSGYMTPEQFNETQTGQGVGDTCGSFWLGTIENSITRITWDYVPEEGDSVYFKFSLYAKEGYEFDENVTVDFNGKKSDKVTLGSDHKTVSAYFQYGPLEADSTDVKDIWFSGSEYTIQVGQQFILIAHTDPEDAYCTFTSSDPAIASMDGNVAKGLKAGTTTITATAENGKKATCTLRVVFTDVPAEGKYYSDPVYWAVEKGITNGYYDSDGLARTFKPQNNCTREAVVTFLWRLAGKPEPKSTVSKFSDVQDTSKYYYKAVLWAAEQGITNGYADGTFKPSATCLREHVVTFLWRYAGKPSVSAANTFTDVTTSDYYYMPVLWAAQNSITKGYADDNYKTFRPKNDCLREHVVTFLYRYANLK